MHQTEDWSRKSVELPITSRAPIEVVCFDYLSLERTKGCFEDILVRTDHFSRFYKAIPSRDQIAKTTARALFDNFMAFQLAHILTKDKTLIDAFLGLPTVLLSSLTQTEYARKHT